MYNCTGDGWCMKSGRAVVMRTMIVSATATFVGVHENYLSSALKLWGGGRGVINGGEIEFWKW